MGLDHDQLVCRCEGGDLGNVLCIRAVERSEGFTAEVLALGGQLVIVRTGWASGMAAFSLPGIMWRLAVLGMVTPWILRERGMSFLVHAHRSFHPYCGGAKAKKCFAAAPVPRAGREAVAWLSSMGIDDGAQAQRSYSEPRLGTHVNTPSFPEQALTRVVQWVAAGESAKAKTLCRQAIAASPSYAGLHQMLAYLDLQDGDIASARKHIALALTLRPGHPPSLLIAGNAALADGDLAAALEFHSGAQSLAPDRADAALALGSTQHACGLLHEARRSLELAVARAAGSEQAWFHLALVQQDLGDVEAAIHALRRVLALAPQRAEAEVNLGIVLQDTGRLDEAMQAYGRAYRLRADTFGRISNALANAPRGCLWLDLADLRETLAALD